MHFYRFSTLFSKSAASLAPSSAARRYHRAAIVTSPRTPIEFIRMRNSVSYVSPSFSAACASPAMAALS